MKARTTVKKTTDPLYAGFSALLVAGFMYIFLTGRAVGDLTSLYQALHLDALMPLDLMFTGGHVVVYAALTAILCRPNKPALTWMTIAVWLGVMGMGIEFIQEISGARSFGLGDVIANFV